MKLSREFYKEDTLSVSKKLLGKVLVHKTEKGTVKGKIVEVEAYMGPHDKAAHTYGGKRSPRNEIMYGVGGFAYVFIIYGMYNCMNVVTSDINKPEAILIRALEPVDGLDIMAQNRFKLNYEELNKRQIVNLTNGPGKLCIAMDITRNNNGMDLLGEMLYIEEGESENFEIVSDKRIGIDYAEEAIDYPWRFYIDNNSFVSKKKK